MTLAIRSDFISAGITIVTGGGTVGTIPKFASISPPTVNDSIIVQATVAGIESIGIGVAIPTGKLDVVQDQNAGTKIRVRNPNAGVGAFAQFSVEALQSTLAGYVFGSGFTTSGQYMQASSVLEASGIGGLNLSAQNTTATSLLRLYTNAGTLRWTVGNTAGISEWISGQVTARIVMGATNGLAFRNSANSADRFTVNDAGTASILSDGTNAMRMQTGSGSGEITAGGRFGASPGTWMYSVAGAAGQLVGAAYFDGTQYRSAWEVANKAATSFGTLSLMKSGGTVIIGTGTVATFDTDANAGNTRMLLWTVDTGTLQRVKTVTNAAILLLLGLGAGRLLYVPA